MKKCAAFFIDVAIFSLFFLPEISLAQRGKDGSKVFAASGTIVNEYTYLTANANAGATSISVHFSRLNTNTRFTFDLQAGDLIMIIQMQGATINGTLNGNTALPDDSTWGTILNYNNAGNWELAQVRSRPNDNTINLDCPLRNSYTASGKTQIVRIPRYTDLTILAGGEVTCEPWNGTTGGIVAIESLGDIVIASGGSINVSGKGFRGGRLLENNSANGITNVGSTLDTHGAEKGESIAGYQADYDAIGGRYGKGAPANGGGGGNGRNAGGGGGANAGAIALWNGHGNPDLAGTNYATAWNLEFAGKASLTSSGGGKGGYTFSSSNQNALLTAPGNISWGGDNRRAEGGFGGRPLDYSSGKLFFGGGGGAGDQDNGFGGEGGRGGGIIYLMTYGNITGAGLVAADGENGKNATGTPPAAGYSGNDGAGGGGGGGAIVLNAVGTVSGITASAKGGNGGNQILVAGASYTGAINEAQGPGGGGGGGYIAWSNGSFTQIVSGGLNGTTNSDALTEFLPNGATKGGNGLAVQNVTNFYITAQDDTICYNESATLSASLAGNPPPGTTLLWYGNQAGPPGSLASGNTFTTPALTLSRYYFVGTCPGTYRHPVYVYVVPQMNVNAGNDITKCETETVQLTASGANTYSWSPPNGLSNPNIANPMCNVTTTTTYVVTGNTFGCTDTDTITVTVIPSITPSVSITVSQNNICVGTSVTFTATPVNGGGAPIYQWKVNGVNVGANAPTYTTATLNNGDVVQVEMTTSLTGCITASTVTSNSITMVVNSPSVASVSISATQTNICAGTSVTFTATPVNGGAAPVYQWKVNGVNVGTNAPTYTTATLNNGDVVQVEMTSSAACVTPVPAVSNTITMTVQPLITPSVSITVSQNNICAGTNVTFTATPVNGGAAPVYQWKVNGVNVGTNAPTYSTATLNNGDVVQVEMTSSATCALPATVVSNTITMTVQPLITPSVSITVSQNNICVGTSVTFTATPVNGGGAPIYQWKVNGVNVGTNAPTYTTATLNNGDVVQVEMTTSLTGCITASTVTSNSITMVVNSPSVASVSISATQTNICAGTSVTFTATPVNGGAAPVYQWKVNGVNVGTNAPTYSTATLNNGDVVQVEMTSSAACVTPVPAVSNTITMTVQPLITPSVSITVSQNNICAGTNVTFTATPVNGGAAPVYQWKVNGVNVGTNAPTYSTATLNNGDVVQVEMTSSATCALPATVVSNTITMTVQPLITPSVSITVSQNNICVGTSVTFTATPVNGGGAPIYQWKVNGVNVGTNAPTYTTATLNNGDVVQVEMTTSLTGCITASTVTSNSITMVVNSPSVASVSISATQTNICAGTNVMFTATPVNGGAAPVYQWKVNGVNVGTNAPTYTTATLNNGDVVQVEMTSSAACVTPVPAVSNTITMTVQPLITPSVSITVSQNNICAGTSVTFTATPVNGGAAPVYQWKVNGVNVGTNAPTYTTATLNNGDLVQVEMTSSAICAYPSTVMSNTISLSVIPLVTPTITVSATQTNICVGDTVLFSASVTNGGSAPVFQWQINGNPVGYNADTFLTAALNNGDVINCVLTSNALCAHPTIVTSAGVVVSVSDSTGPSVSITASQTSICSGTSVTFTATASNAGSAPVYQWQINGVNTGNNAPVFTTSTLNDGDKVRCLLLSNNPCSAVTAVLSDSIVVSVTMSFTPSVYISASQTVICSGVSAAFKAVPQNTGANPQILWFVNQTSTGDNDDTYNSSQLQDGDQVIVRLTATAACATPPVVYDTVTVTVIPSPVANAGADVTICKYDSVQLMGSGGAEYSWQPAASLSNAFIANPYAWPDTTTLYVLTVTASNGCTDTDTVLLTVTQCNSVLFMQQSVLKVYPNPFTDLLIIELTENDNRIALCLTDLTGKNIIEDQIDMTGKNIRHVMNLQRLPAAVYILKVTTVNESIQIRLSKL